MNKQIESLKLALTALEINLTLLKKITPYKGQEDFLSDSIAITQDTITAIKKALAQRTWVGLTEEEVKHEWEVWRANIPRYAGFAKGIEAKFKQKNGYAEEKNT